MTDLQAQAKELIRESTRAIEWKAYSDILHTDGLGTMIKIIDEDPTITIKRTAAEKGFTPEATQAALERLADQINPDWKDEDEDITAEEEIDGYNSISEDWQMFCALHHAQDDRRAVYVHRSLPDNYAASKRTLSENSIKTIIDAIDNLSLDYHDSEEIERFFHTLEIIETT